MKKSSLSLFLILFTFFTSKAFCQVEFLSPSEGVWGNKQMLIIENEGEGDYFYSLNGSDPEKSGLAYDGPVLLDIIGDIKLQVVYVAPDGSKDYGSVEYSVVLNKGNTSEEKAFIDLFKDTGVYEYIAGTNLIIPETFNFSLGKNPLDYLPGTTISLNSNNVIVHNIPCSIYDKNNNAYWRFIIKTSPGNSGLFTRRNVPFVIKNWNTIEFTDDKLIYKIDSEYWGQPLEPREIDRNESHMISWQSVNYKLGNSVEYFVLPPKPELKTKILEDSSQIYYLEGDDSYYLSVLENIDKEFNQDENYQFFKTIGVDTFYGDRYDGKLNIGIFADSVFQGYETVSFTVDKLPPVSPVISSSAKTFYSRNPVELKISSDEKSELYVAVSEPFVIKNPGEIYKVDSPVFSKINAENYSDCSGGEYTLTLPPIDDKVVYYKVQSFSEKGNYKSPVVSYSVIVDQSSYYYDKNAPGPLSEGTLLNPFINFEQCVEALEDSRSVSLRIKGDLYIDKKYEIHSNLKIINNGDGRIIFGPNGSLEVYASTLEIGDCRIHKIPSKDIKTVLPFFKIVQGTLDLKNCQIAGEFSKNGIIIDSYNSIVNIQDTIASVSADSYASFISGNNSRIGIYDSSITTTASTNVIISANKGELFVNGNKLKIIGLNGRISELFGVNANFENNDFRGEIKSPGKSPNPIYINDSTILVEKDNTKVGF